jgi:hypothetical protein
LGGHDNINRLAKEKALNELDDAWDLALAEANERARAAGRTDIANYLDLRRRNDLLRRTAIDWLSKTVESIAADRNRRGAAIQIERHDEHRFKVGNATMRGSQLTLRSGVRAFSIESGWPRTPRDGVVRGDGLAFANFKHFGRRGLDAELLLARSRSGAPQWIILEKTGTRSALTESLIQKHFSFLLAES